jgi:N-acetylglucosaminyldiphosphoundecaprenol N-acetyl-beta-D-mannosaminyltransferase
MKKQSIESRTSLLGVGVNSVNLESTITSLESKISGSERAYICLAPVHNLMACRADPKLRAIFNHSTLTVPDGMGTVWFLRALGHKAGRVYGPDLMAAACRQGIPLKWRHFFLGGRQKVVERLASNLRADFPGLHVAGIFSPPFRKMDENEVNAMIRQINDGHADIVWVGLGSPKQEFWMAEFRDKLQAPVLIGVGAAFDFLAGAKPQAPKWMQRIGLEWFFRLLTEPRRLWRRYASYPLFVLLALAQILGLKSYPIESE